MHRLRHRARITGCLFVCWVAGCAAASTPLDLVIDRSVVTFDGLHPAESPIFEQVFVRDPLDLSPYDALLIESAPINYRHADSQPGDDIIVLTGEQRERFQTLISDNVGGALRSTPQFAIAEVAGTNVLTLWATLVDINVHANEGGEVGEFILVIELRDSLSQDTLLRAIHHYRLPLDVNDPDGNYLKLQGLASDIAGAITAGLNNVISAQ